jgi:hypothetical protein
VNVWPTNSLHRITGGSPGRTGLVAGLMLSALFAARAPTASGATDPRGVIYRTAPPMDQTVHRRILPQLDGLLDQLAVQKQDMTLDGVKVFESGDKFLPGKIAIGMAYALLETPRTDPRFNDRLANFREISDLTVGRTTPGASTTTSRRCENCNRPGCWTRRSHPRPWPSSRSSWTGAVSCGRT